MCVSVCTHHTGRPRNHPQVAPSLDSGHTYIHHADYHTMHLYGDTYIQTAKFSFSHVRLAGWWLLWCAAAEQADQSTTPGRADPPLLPHGVPAPATMRPSAPPGGGGGPLLTTMGGRIPRRTRYPTADVNTGEREPALPSEFTACAPSVEENAGR